MEEKYLAKLEYNMCDEHDFTFYSVVSELQKSIIEKTLYYGEGISIVVCSGNLKSDLYGKRMHMTFSKIPDSAVDFMTKQFGTRIFNEIYKLKERVEEFYEDDELYEKDLPVTINK